MKRSLLSYHSVTDGNAFSEMLIGVRDLDANHKQKLTVGLVLPCFSLPVKFPSESLRLLGWISVGTVCCILVFQKRMRAGPRGAVLDKLCILATNTADPDELSFGNVSFNMIGMVRGRIQIQESVCWFRIQTGCYIAIHKAYLHV